MEPGDTHQAFDLGHLSYSALAKAKLLMSWVPFEVTAENTTPRPHAERKGEEAPNTLWCEQKSNVSRRET